MQNYLTKHKKVSSLAVGHLLFYPSFLHPPTSRFHFPPPEIVQQELILGLQSSRNRSLPGVNEDFEGERKVALKRGQRVLAHFAEHSNQKELNAEAALLGNFPFFAGVAKKEAQINEPPFFVMVYLSLRFSI